MKQYMMTMSCVLAFLLCANPIMAGTISNGGVTFLDDDTNRGKVEICMPFGNKEYASPTWVQNVVSPIDKIAGGVRGIVQLPVLLIRPFERTIEQSTSKSRKESNPCINLRYEKDQDVNASVQADSVTIDNMSIDKLSVDVNISDTQ